MHKSRLCLAASKAFDTPLLFRHQGDGIGFWVWASADRHQKLGIEITYLRLEETSRGNSMISSSKTIMQYPKAKEKEDVHDLIMITPSIKKFCDDNLFSYHQLVYYT